ALKLVSFWQFLQRCSVQGKSAFASRYDLRLLFQERSARFFASSLGLSDGSLVSVEERKSGRESDYEEAVSFLVCIPRSDLEVRILFGNFELQIGFGRRVLCQRASNIQAVQNRVLLDLRWQQGFCAWRRVEVRPFEIEPLEPGRWNPNRGCQGCLGFPQPPLG